MHTLKCIAISRPCRDAFFSIKLPELKNKASLRPQNALLSQNQVLPVHRRWKAHGENGVSKFLLKISKKKATVNSASKRYQISQ